MRSEVSALEQEMGGAELLAGRPDVLQVLGLQSAQRILERVEIDEDQPTDLAALGSRSHECINARRAGPEPRALSEDRGTPLHDRRLLDAMERLEAGRGVAHDLAETD